MPIQSESTGLGDAFVVQKTDSSYPVSDLSLRVEGLLRETAQTRQAAEMVHYLSRSSDMTGGIVQFVPELLFMPILTGPNGQVLPLYSFIESVDELVDYDSLKEHHPFLSYAQIAGAMSFIRKVAQYNIRDVDLDRAEDDLLTNDTDFLEEIRTALADKETSRVLNLD